MSENLGQRAERALRILHYPDTADAFKAEYEALLAIADHVRDYANCANPEIRDEREALLARLDAVRSVTA